MSHDQPLIYLDHNATTPVAPRSSTRCCPTCATSTATPPATTPHGRRAAAVDQARARVAALIGADPADIVFTSGGTESNNLAIRGTAAATAPGRRRIITTVLEHPATTAPLAHLEGSRLDHHRPAGRPAPAPSTPPRRPPRWAPTSPWSR